MSSIDGNRIRRLIDPLKRKVLLGISRAVVRAIADDNKLQRMQVSLLKGEVRNSVERFQEYGFTSHPHPEAEAVVVFPGGNRSHGLIIAVDDRKYRLVGLSQGEVALYTDEGDCIKLKRGNNIEIKAATKLIVDSPDSQFTGNVQIDGALHVDLNIASDQQVSDVDGSMGEMRTIYNSHVHPENDSGGPTDDPNQKMT